MLAVLCVMIAGYWETYRRVSFGKSAIDMDAPVPAAASASAETVPTAGAVVEEVSHPSTGNTRRKRRRGRETAIPKTRGYPGCSAPFPTVRSIASADERRPKTTVSGLRLPR